MRTDARVCNLSYLQTDWYIDQMCRPAYDSPSVPISWKRIEYCAGTNEYVPIDTDMKQAVLDLYKEHPEEAKKQFGDDPFELKNILKYWVRSKSSDLHVIPTDVIYMTIDKEAVRKSGMMMATDSIPDRMTISLKGKTALYKGDLMILEMLAQCNWERPIYVAVSVGDENYINLGDNTITEGLAYRITPFTTNQEGAKNFDSKRTYENVMHRFKFGGANTKGVYLDETVMRMCYTHRRIMARLAIQLVSEGNDKKATEVLKYCEKVLPAYNIPHNYSSGSLDMARAWAAMGNKQEAMKLINQLWANSSQYVAWYCNLNGQQFSMSEDSCYMHIYILNQLLQLGTTIDDQWGEKKGAVLNKMLDAFEAMGGRLGGSE